MVRELTKDEIDYFRTDNTGTIYLRLDRPQSVRKSGTVSFFIGNTYVCGYDNVSNITEYEDRFVISSFAEYTVLKSSFDTVYEEIYKGF